MQNRITYLTPAKIECEEEFNNFKESISSFYQMGLHPLHLFAIKSTGHYQSQTKLFLDSLQCDYMFVHSGLNASESFYKLIQSVETDYLMIHLSDVKHIKPEKDIITPCIKCMDENKDVIQVRLSGYPFGHYYDNKDNRSLLSLSNGKLYMNRDSRCIFENIDIDKDTIWTLPLIPEQLEHFFALPFWHTVMRTDIAQQFVNATLPHLKSSDTTISSFIKYAHTSDTITKSVLHKVGWSDEFHFLSKYKHGFLNLACYIYMIGRDRKSEQQFFKDHCNEIRSDVLKENDGEIYD